MKIINLKKGVSIFPAMLMLLLTGCDSNTNEKAEIKKSASNIEKTSNIVALDQGWSQDEELDFYNTSQGSQLMPYSWFLALEQAGNSDLFRDNKNIKYLGYISQAPISSRNPDGLPVGFVKEVLNEDFLTKALAATRLSP